MPLTLNVDGKLIAEPGATDIAQAFASLGKGTGFFKSPGISMIILQRDEANMLTATGTYAEGFFLGINDGDPQVEYTTDMADPIRPEEMILVFQAYARGEDWGRSKFRWEQNDTRPSPRAQMLLRAIVFGFAAWLVYVVVRHFLN